MQKLLEPVHVNKPELAEKLAKLNIHTNWDLLRHIPLRYEDMTKLYPIAQVQAGQLALLEGEIVSCEVKQVKRRQLIVKIFDGSSYLSLLFFNFYPNYSTQYAVGKKIRVHGEVKVDHFGMKTIIHPKIQKVTDNIKLSNSFTPVYPTTNGLENKDIIKLIDEVLNLNLLQEYLPSEILAKYNLLSLEQAILILHKLTPKQFADEAHINALNRLKFDELLAGQVLMHGVYLSKHKDPAPKLCTTNKYLAKFLADLPFKLTNAQQKVCYEILSDIAKNTQMNRLLQGDVGSGKTIVAFVACLVAIENNYQAVILAPTEILAEQHFIKACALFEKLGIKVTWLSGGLSLKQRRDVYAQIASGEASLIIGTHAVFQKDVLYANLGLIIIDEQHKFGVEQRLSLLAKGADGKVPHQLMMSATPIPRSLAMTFYADLDVSSIDELPSGRSPIETILVNNHRRHEVLEFVRTQCQKSAQTYWVCPLIEESETLELENAINTYNELQEVFPEFKIGLIHGRMKSSEKTVIMQQFAENKLQLLVATTVIEVGVDVPNASIIVIEHSERMGLAQLHQLRGRVGRGHLTSQCVLLYDYKASEIGRKRLKVIYENIDGFKIAEEDLKLRGAGELLGARQSGLPMLQFANLEQDVNILKIVKDVVVELVKKYPQQADNLVRLWFSRAYERFLGS